MRQLPRLAAFALAVLIAAPSTAQRVTLVWDGDSNDDYNEETGEGFRGVSPDVKARRDLLERLGFNTRHDNPNNAQSWWNTYESTSLFDLVYVTGEADTDALADKLRGYQIPILSEHPEYDDNLGFATSTGSSSGVTQLSIDSTAHPITATTPLGVLSVYTATNEIGRLAGTPAASLIALASEGGQTALGAIEVGGALANTINSNSAAVTRLVRLPFAGDSDWREIDESPVAELLEQSVLWATASTYTPTGSQGTLVMVTEQNGVLDEQEVWRVRRLAYLGWAVIYLWDGDSQANYDTAIAAADVVYVPATADPSDVGDKLRNAACGVVYESNELDDNFGLATGGGIVSSNPGVIVAERGHPITGNLYEGSYYECFERFRYENNDWPGISQPLGRMTGTLAPDLDVLATRWSDPVLAAVEAGGDLANNVGGNDTAAGRRVRLPWVSDSLDIRYLRSWNSGSQLWELALDWASGPNPGSLVAHYKLDEASGTTAADSSANGYDGTYNGSVTQNITPAPRSTAANFDASGDNVSVASNTVFQNLNADNSDYSVAMWFRPGTLTHTNWRCLFHLGGATSSDRGPLIMVHPTLHRPYVWISNNVNDSGGYCNYQLDDGDWHHLAVVKQGYYVRWYVDGEFTNSFRLSGDSIATAGDLWIGRSNWWGEPDGDLDDVRVYDYSLNDSEVTELYETLVGHFLLADGSGVTATDQSVFDNTASLNGDPVWNTDEQSLVLDGVGDYVTAPSAPQYDLESDVTIAAWIKVADPDQNSYTRLVSRKADWTATEGYELEYNPALNRLTFGGKNRQQIAAFGVNLDDRWRHVCATLESVGAGKYRARLYVDGAEQTNITAWSANPTTMSVDNFDQLVRNSQPLTMGADPTAANNFNGSMRDVRVYNRALSSTEVFELGGSGLRLHLKLDETSGTVAEDSSPFGLDGTHVDVAGMGADAVIDRGLPYENSGVFDYTDVPHTAVDGLDAISVCWWMKTSKTGEQAVLSGARSGSANALLVYVGDDQELRLYVNEAITTWSVDAISDERWRHYVMTYQASDGAADLYIDGELVSTNTHPSRATLDVDTGGLIIGQEQDSVGGGFVSSQQLAATLDDFRIYGRVLNAQEVADLYGLIGHWRLDEIAGDTVAIDETAFANDGEYVRTPVLEEESPYPSDAVRTAARMEAGDYLRIRNDDHLEVGKDNADFSVAYWLKNNRDHSGQWRETVKKHFDGRRRTFAMWLHPHDNRLHPRISTKYHWNEGMSSVATFDVGVWRHVAYVKRGSQLRLYVDGVLDSTDTLLGETVSSNGDIYAGVRSTGWRSDVTIDDFRIYSRALNDWEVAELHGLVGWYRMEDMAGSIVTDSSGIKNHGAVVGSTPGWPLDAREGNGSIELDGTNYVDMTEDWVHGPGAAIAGWAKLDKKDTGGSELISITSRIAIRLDNPSVRAFMWDGSSYPFVLSNRTAEGAGWTHYAASYRDDTRELSLYLDGVLQGTETLTAQPPFNPGTPVTRIGEHGGTFRNYSFTGSLDDIRVYNRPISRAEARGLYLGRQVPGLRIVKWVEVPNP